MKQIFSLLTLFGLIASSAYAQLRVDTVPIVGNLGLENLIIEVIEPPAQAYTDGVPTGALTYRFFVDMKENHKLLIFGGLESAIPPRSFEIEGTQSFFNPANTGASGADVNRGFWGFVSQSHLEYDTYASDGRVGSGANTVIGVLRSDDTDGTIDGYTALTPETTPSGDILISDVGQTYLTDNTVVPDFINENGGWAIGLPEGPDATKNIVFVFQVTTAGDFFLRTSIRVQDEFGNNVNAFDVEYPAPTVSIVSPSPAQANLLVVGNPVSVEASISSHDPIDSVAFYANNTWIDSSITEPHTFEWIPQDEGSYPLIARVYRGLSVLMTDTLDVTVGAAGSIPPTVQINYPNEDDKFYTNKLIEVIAQATDVDGKVDSVEFYINGVLDGVDTVTTDMDNLFSYTWITSTGNEEIKAIAYDNSMLSSETIVNVTVEPSYAPVVKIDNPETGETVIAGDSVSTEVTVTDQNNDVDSVEFFINDVKIGVDTAVPYAMKWKSKVGSAEIRATATDADQKQNSAVHTILVVENTAPTIKISAPAHGDTVQLSETVSITALAYDEEGTIDTVKFYINDELVGTDLEATDDSVFSFDWTSTLGIAKIKVVSVDDRGMESEPDTISITVIYTNIPPTISITAPSNGAIFRSDTELTISADAEDSKGAVDSVIFMLNSAVLGVVESAPYEVNWTAVLGSYTIKAIAYDNDKGSNEDIIEIEVSDETGIKNQVVDSYFSIYPNPVQDQLAIEISKELAGKTTGLAIYDLSGNLIKTLSLDYISGEGILLDMSQISQGMYIMVISGNDYYYSHVLVKE